MSSILYQVIRDLDDPDRPMAWVQSIGDLVFLQVRDGARRPESIMIHPVAARRLAAALIIEAMRAEAVGIAAAMDCEGDGKGGLG